MCFQKLDIGVQVLLFEVEFDFVREYLSDDSDELACAVPKALQCVQSSAILAL